MLGHIAGFFYARNHTQLRLSYPSLFLLFGSDNLDLFSRTGYDSRFSVCKRKINQDCMKAISFKPAGTAINFRITEVFSKFLHNFGLHLAAISTVVCYFATILDADIIASLAAFAALAGIYPQTKFEKGGNDE